MAGAACAWRDTIAFRAAGLEPSSVCALYEGADADGMPYRVIRADSLRDRNVVLAYTHRNWMGIWQVDMASRAGRDHADRMDEAHDI